MPSFFDYFIPTRETFKSNYTRAGAVIGAASGALYGGVMHSINVSCQVGKYVYNHASNYNCVFEGDSKDLCDHVGEGEAGFHFTLDNCTDTQVSQLFAAANSAADNSWTSTDIKTMCIAIPVATVVVSFMVAKLYSSRRQQESLNANAATVSVNAATANSASSVNQVGVDIKNSGIVAGAATPQTPLLTGTTSRSDSQSSSSPFWNPPPTSSPTTPKASSTQMANRIA